MLNTPPIHADSTGDRGGASPLSAALANPDAQWTQEWQSSQKFIVILNAYRHSGGLARAQEVAARFEDQGRDGISTLADWIVHRKIISFEWQSMIWIPWFQFNHVDMTLQPGISEVMAELMVVYNDWDLAAWFTQPNDWLANCTPADTLPVAAQKVLDAVRAEHFQRMQN